MMKKQEFVPRKISEKPLYELKSVEDIPVSELYQVKVNGKEQRVYHTEIFLILFLSWMKMKRQR